MNQAERIIARFGGIRPMAAKLGVAVTTVQGWKERGTIPLPRHAQILAAAEAENITVDAADLAAASESGHRSPRRTMAPGFQTVDAEPIDAERNDAEPIEIKADDDKAADARPADTAQAADTGDGAKDENIEEVEEVEAEVSAPSGQATPTYNVRTRGSGSSLRSMLIGVLTGLILAAIIGGVGWYLGGARGGTDAAGLAGRIAAAERTAEAARLKAAAAEEAAKTAGEKLAALQGPAETQAARLKAAEAQAAEAAKSAAALKADLAALQARVSATAPAERLQAIGQEIAALRARIETLAKTTGDGTGGGASSAAIAENAGKIAANAEALAAGKTRSEALQKTLKAEITRLETLAQGLGARLAALERQVTSGAAGAAGRGREASLVAAIGQLREAVRAGRAYVDELEAVQALAKSAPVRAMALLQGTAASGVPQARTLRANFPATAVAILRAARMPQKGNWVDRAIARARSVVVVRRTGPGVKGKSAEALVARAEVQLGAGDLAGSVTTLGALEGAAAEAARPWLTAARSHLTALGAVATLHRAALARIGAAKPPTESGGDAGKTKPETPAAGAAKPGTTKPATPNSGAAGE
ncbi:MAG: mitofilin family membrane protein [Alphaproteobacteria bacterium]|nr:mitofilin family membrane protein [Alphaproteobacteria bacterium]